MPPLKLPPPSPFFARLTVPAELIPSFIAQAHASACETARVARILTNRPWKTVHQPVQIRVDDLRAAHPIRKMKEHFSLKAKVRHSRVCNAHPLFIGSLEIFRVAPFYEAQLLFLSYLSILELWIVFASIWICQHFSVLTGECFGASHKRVFRLFHMTANNLGGLGPKFNGVFSATLCFFF